LSHKGDYDKDDHNKLSQNYKKYFTIYFKQLFNRFTFSHRPVPYLPPVAQNDQKPEFMTLMEQGSMTPIPMLATGHGF